MKAILTILICTLSIQLNGQVAQFNLLGTWSVDTLPASSAHNNTYNEVWGITNEGREYAIIGSTYGTHFIDVTNPNNPTEVYVLEGGTTGPAIIHRDFHDLDASAHEARGATERGIQIQVENPVFDRHEQP